MTIRTKYTSLFGADEHVEGRGKEEEIKTSGKSHQGRAEACRLSYPPPGNGKAQELYYSIQQYLLEHGVEDSFRNPVHGPDYLRQGMQGSDY